MTAKVIQGWFLDGQPKLPPPAPARPPLPIQTKTGARPLGPAAPAFATRPPGPPTPAFVPRTGAVQRHGAGGAFTVDSGALGLAAGGGRPLPDTVRGKMEAALGANFADVRVHVGPQAERIGAIAFTIGSDIYFAPGRFQPDTVHGQQLLGHELAHVVQQRAGRVHAPSGSGVAVVQDRVLEAEADRLGNKVVAQMRQIPTHNAIGAAQPPFCQRRTIQMQPMAFVQITGLTHLREASPGGLSLVRGSDYAEVQFPAMMTIDLGDIWDSHLGMDLQVSATPRHVWYRVVQYNGKDLRSREIYVREGMFRLASFGTLPPRARYRIADLLGRADQGRFAQVEKATAVYGLTASRTDFRKTARSKPPFAQTLKHSDRIEQEDVVLSKIGRQFSMLKWDKDNRNHVLLRDKRAAKKGGTPDYIFSLKNNLFLGDTFTKPYAVASGEINIL